MLGFQKQSVVISACPHLWVLAAKQHFHKAPLCTNFFSAWTALHSPMEFYFYWVDLRSSSKKKSMAMASNIRLYACDFIMLAPGKGSREQRWPRGCSKYCKKQVQLEELKLKKNPPLRIRNCFYKQGLACGPVSIIGSTFFRLDIWKCKAW